MSSLDFSEVRSALDNGRNFGAVANTGWHPDAAYERFSDAEYRRRYDALHEGMDARGLDGLIVGGGPSHWSSGGGMLWLTGHFEWHAMACYLLVPRRAEPTLVYSMGGSHIETVRAVSWVKDVRPSRMGAFGQVLVEAAKDAGLDRGRIGHPPIDAVFGDYMPVNQHAALTAGLPEAELVLIDDVFHDLLLIKSEEELACVRRAGALCVAAFDAMVDAARPGATEEDLKAAAASATFAGGGTIDFLIIASTSTAEPHLIFGSPQPSKRVLREGDMILDELAVGYRGYTAQIGLPVFVGEPAADVRRFFDEVTLPGYLHLAEQIGPGKSMEDVRRAARFFRERGVQSRPIILHGIDLVTAAPHVYVESTDEGVMRPGQVVMLEPNPISADGNLGMFYGHTYIITETGNEIVTPKPFEIVIAE